MKFRTILIVLLALTPSAALADILVIGHRGAKVHAPENTIPSFLKAIELGADLPEMDVRETRDGHLVIMHDAAVDRTTDGAGLVSSLTLAQLKKAGRSRRSATSSSRRDSWARSRSASSTSPGR